MRKILLVSALLMLVSGLQAQKYFTRSGQISFFSSTSMEDIEAHNKTVTAIFDSQSGAIQFSVTMKSFQFEKALMQEHFNENYVESAKFPKSTFKGVIVDASNLDFSKNGTFTAKITGKLTIHGVTNEVTTSATFTVKNGVITGEAKINVNPEDYGIEIPGVVREKIAKELEVSMKMDFKEKK
jgi:polyisoprenoid-binding protein YceI